MLLTMEQRLRLSCQFCCEAFSPKRGKRGRGEDELGLERVSAGSDGGRGGGDDQWTEKGLWRY